MFVYFEAVSYHLFRDTEENKKNPSCPELNPGRRWDDPAAQMKQISVLDCRAVVPGGNWATGTINLPSTVFIP
jgi:hypothetical protein